MRGMSPVTALVAGVLLACQFAHADTALRAHVEWSIAHEGCDVYSGDNLIHLGLLRMCFIDKESLLSG